MRPLNEIKLDFNIVEKHIEIKYISEANLHLNK